MGSTVWELSATALPFTAPVLPHTAQLSFCLLTTVRISALSEASVIYVMTHDSIGLGEDGPTHQPIDPFWFK
ncbi:hypothetical protein ARALYDRAFT_896452 [Arabidopsis lyrata subsp. lyrata]|uniref:Transketolase-like pyrimidine-binding domain-containing protein n=1 Tax=Arabidopsis lyrata subsp. lyrata TaxID=81972 RepID=D7L229_ARALL|nr:hypothetical protein ARALYDRAFT_896452 [Arabidopsis lyrata subsp. lyrata]